MCKRNQDTSVSGYLPDLVQEFLVFTIWTDVFWNWKLSCYHWSSWESSYASRSGFHSPSYSEKDPAGCTCNAQLQLRVSAGSVGTVGCTCLGGCLRKVLSRGQTHRCSFKLHLSTSCLLLNFSLLRLSQEAKSSFILTSWTIKVLLSSYPFRITFELLLAMQVGSILIELLGYRR